MAAERLDAGQARAPRARRHLLDPDLVTLSLAKKT
jgi:hypothetical protein